MQSRHGLLDRGIPIKPMTLQHIHIINSNPDQTRLDRIEDMFPTESTLIHVTILIPVSHLGIVRVNDRRWQRLWSGRRRTRVELCVV